MSIVYNHKTNKHIDTDLEGGLCSNCGELIDEDKEMCSDCEENELRGMRYGK